MEYGTLIHNRFVTNLLALSPQQTKQQIVEDAMQAWVTQGYGTIPDYFHTFSASLVELDRMIQ
jgi:hypothetical protein